MFLFHFLESNYDPLYEDDQPLRAYEMENTTISFDPRTSMYQARTTNDMPVSSRLSKPTSSYLIGNQRPTPSMPPMTSNLQYPSEVNRGKIFIYV